MSGSLSDGSLQWTNTHYSGALTGHAHELNDPGNQIIWQTGNNTCQAISNIATDVWSNPTNWSGGFVPTACNAVTIIAASTVTVDIPTATASTTTINGQLSFNRSGDNEFTLVGGSLSVNAGGTLDMGTSASPIPSGTTAYLILAYGQTAGQYGLVINPGGNFLVYGAVKQPWTLAKANVASGAGIVSLPSTSGFNWNVGDQVTIDTETVTITQVNTNDIHFSPNTTVAHSTTMQVVVANLTRSVVVRSSGTNTVTNTAYLENLVANTTSFNVNYIYPGANSCTAANCGISFDTTDAGHAVLGSISSSTVRYGNAGISGGRYNTFTANNIYANASTGMGIDTYDSLISNNIYDNATSGGDGIISDFGGHNTLLSNNVFSNMGYGGFAGIFFNDGSTGNLLVSNNIHDNIQMGIEFDTHTPTTHSHFRQLLRQFALEAIPDLAGLALLL